MLHVAIWALANLGNLNAKKHTKNAKDAKKGQEEKEGVGHTLYCEQVVCARYMMANLKRDTLSTHFF